MQNDNYTFHVQNEYDMLSIGAQLAAVCPETFVIYLHGNLGAGKTTLSRGFVQGFGHQGKVKSPTYTLVECYEFGQQSVFHFDLYRLVDPQELEFIGLEDYFRPSAICLVEWPDRGEQWLPEPDLSCYIDQAEAGRVLRLEAFTLLGRETLTRFITLKDKHHAK